MKRLRSLARPAKRSAFLSNAQRTFSAYWLSVLRMRTSKAHSADGMRLSFSEMFGA